MADITVIVDSRGGNTRKVADAIAAELGAAIGEIRAPVPAGAKILFLGSGTYGGAPGIDLMAFVTDNDFAGRKVAIFGTSGGAGGAEKMLAALEDGLRRKGAVVLGKWHCRGKMFLFNRGHPDDADLADARAFARKMAASAAFVQA